MKTTKITLITALIVLGAILYGQAGQVQFINTGYAEKSSKFENLVNNFLCMTERPERNGYREPVVYLSYTLNQAEVIYEKPYGTEAWMTVPFECGVAEADLPVEKWMSSPFNGSVAAAELSVEEWMTRPFETNGVDAYLFIEKWMTTPFEAAEHIEIESWMTTAF